MSRNLHGRGCIHARVDEVANGGATEIVGDKAFEQCWDGTSRLLASVVPGNIVVFITSESLLFSTGRSVL